LDKCLLFTGMYKMIALGSCSLSKFYLISIFNSTRNASVTCYVQRVHRDWQVH
jgi:hypothetical protein